MKRPALDLTPMTIDRELDVLDAMRGGRGLLFAAHDLRLSNVAAYCVEHLAFAEAVGVVEREVRARHRQRYAVRGDELLRGEGSVTV